MYKPQRGAVIPVQAAKGGIHRHDEPRRRGIADALHRVIEALRPHQGVVNGGVGSVQSHLDAVQAGLEQAPAQLRRQQAAVGVQPGDEPLGRLRQLHQVLPQGGLSTGEGHLGDIGPAELLQKGLPLVRGQLRPLAQGLPGGIAVQALLVAVPRALPGHGADHQVHPVGGGHAVGVFAQRQDAHLLRRLLAPGDGHDAAQHPLQVPQQHVPAGAGIGAVGGLHRRRKHGLPVLLADLPAAPGLQLVHKIGQQNGPAQIQGHQLRPVQKQQKRVPGVLCPGRDHVDAHHPGPPGVDGDVAHAFQVRPAIPPLQPCHLCHACLLLSVRRRRELPRRRSLSPKKQGRLPRKGRSLRKKPIRGVFRFRSLHFQSFCGSFENAQAARGLPRR